MKIKYFSDTDTALVEFSDKEVYETREINENIYIDLDKDGSLVSMTIEHAKEQANLDELSYQQIEKRSPDKGAPAGRPSGGS
ncbi:MAG: DUF2283 domain-containing protein [Deltaproteobacteria bacterium]|nr:DUF2283 domain-containing protein [Deltaproteobacteria bacterium]